MEEERQRSNRTVWIIVAVVAVVVLLCGCLVLGGGAIAAALLTVPAGRQAPFGQVEATSEQVFTVAPAPLIEVDTFAGDITVRRGEPDQVRVLVTRRARNSSGLDRINVAVRETAEGVDIRASRAGTTMSLATQVEIYAPPDARLVLATDAGNVTALEIAGSIVATAGAGNVTVRDAVAAVELNTGAGNVTYTGAPVGSCTFNTGAGDITLTLPADLNAEIDLNTGVGTITTGGFAIDGDIDRTDVSGVIGTGADATLTANTGLGTITLVEQ